MLVDLKEMRDQLFSTVPFSQKELLQINKFKSSLELSLSFSRPLLSFSGETMSNSTTSVDKAKEIKFDTEEQVYHFFFFWRGKRQSVSVPKLVKLFGYDETTNIDENGDDCSTSENDEFNDVVLEKNKKQIAIHFATCLEETIYFKENSHKMEPLDMPIKKEKIIFAEICRDFFNDKVKVNNNLQKSQGSIRLQALKLELESNFKSRLCESKALRTEEMLKKERSLKRSSEMTFTSIKPCEANLDFLEDL